MRLGFGNCVFAKVKDTRGKYRIGLAVDEPIRKVIQIAHTTTCDYRDGQRFAHRPRQFEIETILGPIRIHAREQDLTRAQLLASLGPLDRIKLGRIATSMGVNGPASGLVTLGIDGEDLNGVYAATDFVGWYNCHPDHRNHEFDLANAKRVALVGNGNVAMDVARILLASPDELAKTDIAEHSLETLRKSTVEEVILLGRRGPAQAAFSPKEIAEIAALSGVDVVVSKQDAQLDELSAAWLEKDGARSQHRNVEFCTAQAELGEGDQAKKLRCRFLVSPTTLQGEDGKLTGVTVEHMKLQADDSGTPRPRATGTSEEVKVDLLFKAIGYRGEPVAGVPFEERKGIVPNVGGRVVEQVGGPERVGHYAAGWCKRGPTGLIGTNSLDAKDTVVAMKADHAEGKLLAPEKDDIAAVLTARGVDAVTWADWQRLDEWERQQGESRNKLRHKLASTEELMSVITELRK